MSGPGARDESTGCAANAAPYVLGALTQEEQREFVRHLDSCVVCREEVAELRIVADALPGAAPQLEAPSQLRAKVIADVRAEPDAEPAGVERRRVPPIERRAAERSRPLARRPAIAFAALAGAALAVALAVLALSSTGASPSSTRLIRAQVRVPSASASLRVSDGHAVLDVRGLPQTAAGQVYEVWVKRSGAAQPTDALFTPTRRGTASVGVPGQITGVKTVLVTAEPRGGTEVPTTVPVIVAQLG